MRSDEKVMVPARYLLRQPGKPAFMDDKLSGNYNARRDNLTKFWRREFGTTHAVMAITSFYENVVGPNGQNSVLHFNPREPSVMPIACLFAEWSDPKTGEQLLSFAAVTDEPPEEVAAAGHDRMVIRLTRENVDRWLTPRGRSDEELQAILSERQPAYYEHRVAGRDNSQIRERTAVHTCRDPKLGSPARNTGHQWNSSKDISGFRDIRRRNRFHRGRRNTAAEGAAAASSGQSMARKIRAASR
jgi:putative SOS response-associated peptidase YedK